MTSPIAFSKWSSAQAYVKNSPGWVPPSHQQRIAAYQVYREIYWSHIATDYKVMNRGLDAQDQPLYVPSSRIVIDTLSRYIGPKLTYTVDPETGTPASQDLALASFKALFARERFTSRYTAAKRDGITLGDWGWHITADPLKEQGKRLSLVPFKADSYFPVFEDETVEGGDPDTMVSVLLAEQVQVGDDTRVRVQRYDRVPGSTTILSGVQLWEPDKWFLWRFDDDEASPVAVLVPPTPLPPQITAFPVYHVPHRPETGETFGVSPMRGLEVLQAAVNQSMTDEDLALALMGLGVYATDAPGSPTDGDGNAVTWPIYPGAVIENSKGFRKVEGLTGLAAYTDHIGRIEGYYADATGATDAARGRLEVAEAESGIALQLRLGPTLALAEEQDAIILDVHAQMFFDLTTMWFPAFEQLNFTDVTVLPVLGDKLPVNRVAEVQMVNELVVAGVLSAESARRYLAAKGFTGVFDPKEGDLVLAEKTANAAAEGGTDPVADRAAQELGGGELA